MQESNSIIITMFEELIAKSINDALGDSVIQPITIFLEKPCFSLDDLTTHCILIK